MSYLYSLLISSLGLEFDLYFSDVENISEQISNYILKHAKCAKCLNRIDLSFGRCGCSPVKNEEMIGRYFIEKIAVSDFEKMLRYERRKAYNSSGNRSDRIRNTEKSIFKGLSWHKNIQKNKCFFCGMILIEGNFEIDHLIPISRGGIHGSRNFALLCSICNRRKHAKCDGEFWEILRNEINNEDYKALRIRSGQIKRIRPTSPSGFAKLIPASCPGCPLPHRLVSLN